VKIILFDWMCLLPTSQTVLPTIRSPYSADFCEYCVITPWWWDCDAPHLASVSSPWLDLSTMSFYAQLPNSWEWLLALRAEIMGDTSLSNLAVLLTQFWVFDDPHSRLVASIKNQLSRFATLASLILHLVERPPRLVAQSPICQVQLTW